MKLVVAIIRPEKLNDVLEALYRAEVTGLTISRVRGHGGETEQVETYRGMTVKVELHDKVRLEIGVSDSFVEPTVRAILSAGATGEVGDGKSLRAPRREGLSHSHRRRGSLGGHARDYRGKRSLVAAKLERAEPVRGNRAQA